MLRQARQPCFAKLSTAACLRIENGAFLLVAAVWLWNRNVCELIRLKTIFAKKYQAIKK
jgi:hypothetical protein